ncbi:glutathione S-transferase [Xylariomycetidae sp. FL2044]|nr:glutathione S-transferase [Xylariomycetidae sp. FL2044]
MGLTVHHLGVSQSERVVWLCEELGIDYEFKKYNRSPVLAPEDFKQLHPLGSAPVINDGDITLAESGACVEYVSQTYGKGKYIVAPGEKGYADYLFWFHFANGTFTPTLMNKMVLGFAGIGSDNDAMKRSDGKLQKILRFVDERLAKTPYLAGDQFTVADIMNVSCLTTMRCFCPYDLSKHANILAYLERVSKRDGYRRAMQKGDADLDIGELTGAEPPPLQRGLAAMLQTAGK